MTEALATLLSARLAAALPFLDRVTGLARLYTTATTEEPPRPIKLPVPVSFTAAQCEQDSRYLVPDAGTVGILFFEDGGTTSLVTAQLPANLRVKQSLLRLLLWVNPRLLDAPLSEVALVAAVERALSVNVRYASGDFVDVLTTTTILPAETSLYGRYAFATETPLLLPPYRLLGMDLRVQYRLATHCLTAPLPKALTTAPSC